MTNIFKKAVVGGLIVASFSMLSGTAFAQTPGWAAANNFPHLGPPAPLSQRPEFNGDIQQFRLEMRAWIQDLRDWINTHWRNN